MIHIERLPKPDILVEKEKEWTDKFISSGKTRPDNSKYRHPKIRERLEAMSFHKCFYCERKLTDIPAEIDHFIEVSDINGKKLAFVWENLYLACDNCNSKFNNAAIPVNKVLDPCKHTDEEIQDNIIFNTEQITAKNNSSMGLQTIIKYKLDTPLLDMLRSKQLNLFYRVLDQIRRNQIKDGGRKMNALEKESLLSFAQKDRHFSLMFRDLLAKNGFVNHH